MSKKTAATAEAFPHASVARLAKKAGAKTMSANAIEEAQGVVRSFMKDAVHHAQIMAEHAQRPTILKDDALHGLEAMGIKAYVPDELDTKRCKVYEVATPSKPKEGTSKKRRTKPGVKAIREIRFYQKQHDCFYLPKATFERICKSLGAEQKKELKEPKVGKKMDTLGDLGAYGVRWSADALEVLQVAVEGYIIGLFEDAVLAAIHAKRETVQSRDVQLVRRVRGEKWVSEIKWA